MSRKKDRVYSLQDYVAGISYDEFEEALQREKVKRLENSREATKFDLASQMEKVWQENYSTSFASKHYLYYQHLDDLVIRAQQGDAEATKEIVAFALHSYQPHAMVQKYRAWHSVGEDDFCQIVCMATLEAIDRYTFDIVGFNNFAGFLKSWVVSRLKEAQIASSPIRQKNKDDREKNPITYILIDGFSCEDENSFDIPDKRDAYTELEGNEFFIETLKTLPNRIGEVLVTYYGIDNPLCQGRTLAETAEKLGMTVKTVRTRLEKGKKIIFQMYPQYAKAFENESAA